MLIVYGNSYVQVVSWDEEGNFDLCVILMYLQLLEFELSYYSDQMKIYLEGGWIMLLFMDEQIEVDLNLCELCF